MTLNKNKSHENCQYQFNFAMLIHTVLGGIKFLL